MTNHEIARLLREMAAYLEMTGVKFKPAAYDKAAHAIESMPVSLRSLSAEARRSVEHVGEGIARRITEALETGQVQELEGWRRQFPVDVLALSTLDGVGPKTVKSLYEDLGIRTVEDLAQAVEDGRAASRLGQKSVERLRRSLAFHQARKGRHLLGDVLRPMLALEARLRQLPSVETVTLAGSLRRFQETIGDADFLVISSHAAEVMEAVVALPDVAQVLVCGDTKCSVRLGLGLQVDVRVVPAASFGAALCYFTGSKAHNVALRRLAQEKGFKLNEYGLFDGERCIAGRTEEEVYDALGLPLVAPELREDTGELEAARAGSLPRLVAAGDLQGDLQVQTTWTDGADTLEAMVLEARRLGRTYMAITDHTRDLPMTGGMDETRLLEQMQAIRAMSVPGIRVLAGAEVNIRKDGSLDIADEVLAQLDVVGVGVHHHFTLSRDEQTRRLLRAMENPNVDILFHPSARLLNKRPPIDFDIDAVIDAARRTGTLLEIDSQPERLDLKDEYVRRAVAAGAQLVISSDAHATAELSWPDEFGVRVARRGWAQPDNVANTRPVAEFLAGLGAC